jgi:hypothetical protein
MPGYFRFSLLLPALLWSASAVAGNAPIGGGGSCSGQTITDPVASTQGQQQAFDDGLYTCQGGTSWVAEAFIIGGVDQSNTAPSCNSTNAGMIKYSSSTFYGCNGSSWQALSAGPGPGVLIATLTASSSASLQFSGSNWSSSYNTLFLNCSGLLVSNTSTALNLVVGEGATPTWEGGAHYTDEQMYASGSSAPATINTTSSDLFSGGSGAMATTTPMTLKLYIDNVSSSTLYKMVTFKSFYKSSGGSMIVVSGWGFWNNDTNAVTGLEIFASGGGTISSGTCSLYGMN